MISDLKELFGLEPKKERSHGLCDPRLLKSWLATRAAAEDSEEQRRILEWMSSERGNAFMDLLILKGSVTMDDVLAMRDEILAANDERKQIHA